MRRGELVEARTLAERGLSLAPPDSEWAWTFRLFRGEILLLQHQPSEVLPLVSARCPPAPPSIGFARARSISKRSPPAHARIDSPTRWPRWKSRGQLRARRARRSVRHRLARRTAQDAARQVD